jgi:hypothetical protein
MHIRCRSRIFQKGGSDEKKQGSRRFKTIFCNFPYIFFFYTFPKKVDTTPCILYYASLWWLNQKYEDTGNLKEVNILKERTGWNSHFLHIM